VRGAVATLLAGAPTLALSQAASPFLTGATALQTNILDGWGCAAGAVSALPDMVVAGYVTRGATRHVFSKRKANDREKERLAPYFEV
jgi:hypothetical protein